MFAPGSGLVSSDVLLKMKPLYLIFILFVQSSIAQQGKIVDDTVTGKHLSEILNISFEESGDDLLVRLENSTKDYYVISKTPQSISEETTFLDDSKSGGGASFGSLSVYHDQRIIVPNLSNIRLPKPLKIYTIKNHAKLIKEIKFKEIKLTYGVLLPNSGEYKSFEIRLELGKKMQNKSQ